MDATLTFSYTCFSPLSDGVYLYRYPRIRPQESAEDEALLFDRVAAFDDVREGVCSIENRTALLRLLSGALALLGCPPPPEAPAAAGCGAASRAFAEAAEGVPAWLAPLLAPPTAGDPVNSGQLLSQSLGNWWDLAPRTEALFASAAAIAAAAGGGAAGADGGASERSEAEAAGAQRRLDFVRRVARALVARFPHHAPFARALFDSYGDPAVARSVAREILAGDSFRGASGLPCWGAYALREFSAGKPAQGRKVFENILSSLGNPAAADPSAPLPAAAAAEAIRRGAPLLLQWADAELAISCPATQTAGPSGGGAQQQQQRQKQQADVSFQVWTLARASADGRRRAAAALAALAGARTTGTPTTAAAAAGSQELLLSPEEVTAARRSFQAALGAVVAAVGAAGGRLDSASACVFAAASLFEAVVVVDASSADVSSAIRGQSACSSGYAAAAAVLDAAIAAVPAERQRGCALSEGLHVRLLVRK